MKRLLFLLLLSSCTGSSQQSDDNFRLAISGIFGPFSQKNCPNIQTEKQINPETSAPGIILLSTGGINNAIEQGESPICSVVSVFPTGAPTISESPYDLISNANGTNLFASLPKNGQILILAANNNQLSIQKTLTGTDICPTRLSLSPDSTFLAVLDDPNNTQAGCSNPTSRAARILIYKLSVDNNQPFVVLQNGVNFSIEPANSPVAVAINNDELIFLAPFAGTYQLYRFNLKDTNLATARPTPFVQSINNLVPGVQNIVDLVFSGRFYLAFNAAGNNGGTFPIETSAVGNQLTVGGNPVGPTNRLRNLLIAQNNNILALIQPNRLILIGNIAVVRSNFLQDITATPAPEAFGWGLTSSSLERYDLRDLNNIDPRGKSGFGFDQARAITWLGR